MKYIFILFFLTISCKESSNRENKNSKSLHNVDYNVALKFINDYNKDFFNPRVEALVWLSKNKAVTKNLLDRYKQMVDSAEIDEPELGLDFDPIINGQDSDEQGFEIMEIDSLNGYVTVQGKSYPDYKIVLKVIDKNGVTLVDGSGVINIPKSKQPKF
ncbi:hypothetical protein [Flavobacterium koreense]